MNHKFAELGKGLAQSASYALLWLTLTAQLAWPARAMTSGAGQLSPFQIRTH